MSTGLHLPGPAVTLFGDRDDLDQALGDELARRGCSTHIITTSLGWLDSTTHAVIRLGTPTGDKAMEALATTDTPAAHLVGVCQSTTDDAEAEHIRAAWAASSEHHVASLIWHEPVDLLQTTVDEP
ncbi:hypothetical protein [Aeromicrobium sp. UC242_57]|uniref:hypothetical protein n=1 Tax=Aeromicrobium sp. UC242_57 TaxID=3374624 RepID=UPI0037A7FD96